MSDQIEPTSPPTTPPTTPPTPEAGRADPAPFAPPIVTPTGEAMLAHTSRSVTGRGGVNRSRQIAGVAALAAGVAITAGIAAAGRDDSATTTAAVSAATPTTVTGQTVIDQSDGATGELPSLDAGSATAPGVPVGATGDADAMLDADGDGRVGPGEMGAAAFGEAPPEGGRGHHGEMGERGDRAGSAMPAPQAGSGSDTGAMQAPGGQSGAPDASSQGS